MKKKAVVVIDPTSTSLLYREPIKALDYVFLGLITQPRSILMNFPAPYRPPYVADWENNTFFDLTVIEENLDLAERKLRALDLEISGFLPGSELGVESVDELAKRFGLPGNDPNLTAARRDKAVMKEVVKKAGLRVAQFARCYKIEDVEAFMTTSDFPVVIKTPEGTGTRNVFICQNMDELEKAFQVITSSDDSLGTLPEFALIEEYIDGIEYVVNLFGNGEDVFVTDVWRYRKGDSKFAKNLYLDTVLEPNNSLLLKPLRDYAIRASRALGISYGPVHAEIKFDPQKGPVMIEIASRLAGIRMPMVCGRHSDFDPILESVRAATSEKVVARTPKFKKWGWIVTVPSLVQGEIGKINGVEEIQKLPSYETHFLPFKEGDLIEPSTDLWTIPLMVWLAHENMDQLKEDAEHVRRLFQIQVSASNVLRLA